MNMQIETVEQNFIINCVTQVKITQKGGYTIQLAYMKYKNPTL